MLWIGPAWASGGSGAGTQSTVVVLLVLAAAWLAAHLLVERAQQRFLVLTGGEYVVLGVLLGPAVLPAAHLTFGASIGPLLAFVVGWIGFLSGLSATSSDVVDRRALVASVLDAVLRGGLTGAVSIAIGSRLGWTEEPATLAAVAAVACAAAAPSSAAVNLLATRYPDRTSVVLPFLRQWMGPAGAVAILASGVAFGLVHVGETIAAVTPGPGAWLSITAGTSAALAVCFLLFLGRDRSQNNVFLATTGTLLFASGAAFFLNLSALAVNFVLGFLLSHTSVGPGIRDAVDRTIGPARLVLLLFAGTLWRPVDPALGVVLPLVIVASRLAGGFVAGFLGTLGSGLRSDVVRGTLAQGDVAIAIAVSLRVAYDGPVVELAFHAILAAVVISELAGPRALRGLLVDSGEIDEDVVTEPT